METIAEDSVNVAEALAFDPENAPTPQDEPQHACINCKGSSRAVTRKTMLLMLKPERFDEIGESHYRFCSAPDCRIVYFTEASGEAFTTEDMLVRVGLKEKADPIPLCYCFGFNEADARAEIAVTGRCTIPQRISTLIKQGMCACPARNPSGACCLGEVNRAVHRLLTETAPEMEPV
ncbi:MAG TPA: hypothetical protein VJU86_20270 [Pyrinomonadaceae bacterium]|nr:hypothetical protein [Pyrinomonadaceae bacterium]